MSELESQPKPGCVEVLTPDIRRILAPNPSPMTYWGTNTYLLGHGDVAVIDPGPNDQTHLRAILKALGPGEQITHIFVTHAHLDHSPLAQPLAQKTGAKIYAYGDAQAGRSKVMQELGAQGLDTGGEGVEHGFRPDICLADGEQVTGESWCLSALWTPGHMANHLCFDAQGHVFTGDHVMGWASSLISPPDGDLAAFMASSAKLAARQDHTYYPGHGAPVQTPAARIQWLMQHRKMRESTILETLAQASGTIDGLTRRIYTDTPKALLPAAERNVFAHLIDLETRGIVRADPHLGFNAHYHVK